MYPNSQASGIRPSFRREDVGKSSATMQDLTHGSLSRHLLKTSSFMLVGMVFQTLYVLIDLYWVGRLGTDAVAANVCGVSVNVLATQLASDRRIDALNRVCSSVPRLHRRARMTSRNGTP